MLMSGRAARLRECRASGDETQKNVEPPSCAYQTGETHGFPASSAVPSTMYRLDPMIARAIW